MFNSLYNPWFVWYNTGEMKSFILYPSDSNIKYEISNLTGGK